MTDPSQSTGGSGATCTLPWSENPRAAEKTEFLKTAALLGDGSPEGVPLKQVLNAVFGDEWESGSPNYKLAWQVAEDHPDLLEKHTPYGDLAWVRATPKAVSLLRSMQSVGNAEGGGVAGLRTDESPRERARRLLRSQRRLESDRQRGLALKLLAYHRGTMQGPDGGPKWVAVGTPGTEERARVRVTDRFTDPERAARPRASYEETCDRLEERFDVATWVTYTLPRECIPSAYGSVEVIREALGTLHDRFRYDPVDPSKPDRPGCVPDHMTVLETHRDLVAHLHVVYGGERRLMDAGDLRAEWGDVLDAPPGKLPRVHLATLRLDPGEWQVIHSEGNGEVVRSYGNIREYHREPLRRLAAMAEMAHEDLHNRADALLAGEGTDRDRDLAGLALPWTTEADFTTASPALRA